jgi:uncharacterized protein YcbK (DUF882 family)
MNQQLSAHFRRHEFACPCCGVDCVQVRLVQALEKLREKCGGWPVHITSGCRCSSWNKRVGGIPGSQHLKGRAADIIVQGLEPVEVAQIAEMITEFRHGGIGVYENFVHVDVRTDGPARWEG